MRKTKENESAFPLTGTVKVKTLILQKDYKEGLENRRFNITILAEQIGWDRVRVSNVINNKADNMSTDKFEAIQSAIAESFGLKKNDILLTKEV